LVVVVVVVHQWFQGSVLVLVVVVVVVHQWFQGSVLVLVLVLGYLRVSRCFRRSVYRLGCDRHRALGACTRTCMMDNPPTFCYVVVVQPVLVDRRLVLVHQLVQVLVQVLVQELVLVLVLVLVQHRQRICTACHSNGRRLHNRQLVLACTRTCMSDDPSIPCFRGRHPLVDRRRVSEVLARTCISSG
jgi:hypothetical protein